MPGRPGSARSDPVWCVDNFRRSYWSVPSLFKYVYVCVSDTVKGHTRIE